MQLQTEIKEYKEAKDEYASSLVYIWVKERIKVMYLISFVCGSSFSAQHYVIHIYFN